ncbi:MAG TPA: sugar phosphate isomerase/epimerase family protein [Blastocatellia bacterium]|nr:sugar phosphate isomerase/epimerase family protein [Blastocatellia bacterium]
MSTFKLSVFTDEITQEFGRALEIAAKEFGMGYVELRTMWGKNIFAHGAKEIEEARRLLEKYRLRVSSIAGPLFKVDWPGAPVSKYSQRDKFGADFTFAQQDEVLERGIELARAFRTDRLRCFDFWRVEDQKPHRAAMDEKLIQAAAKARKHGVTLVMENEYACNTATAAEAARTLAAVNAPNFKLNWDPGNAAFRGETPFPDGYELLPKDRIGHVHCKDVVRKGDGYEWTKMGDGIIDFVGQFRALKRDGYRGAVVLETHWRGAGTPEESTRQSWAGMKAQLQRAGAL